jgi:hypothetical protein
MLKKAIKKLKSEMSKNNNPYIQVVGGFMLQHLNENPERAEKILQEGKTIEKSLEEMKNAAKKKQVGGCAMLTDQEGFEIVLKYFGIDGLVKDAAIATVQVKMETIERVSGKVIDFDVSLDDFI